MNQEIELKIIEMSEVESKEISWLWYPFIPYGKLTIIQGDPGDGKTTLVLNIAAALSKGEGLDNDMKPADPLHIIYQTAEDGLADTVKPRLEKGNNSEYWVAKISRNRERDDEINKKLLFMGWTVIRFWGKDIKKNTDECIRVIEETIFALKMESNITE